MEYFLCPMVKPLSPWLSMDLGFTGQSLHRFPWVFANKPLDRLIRDGIALTHINDNIHVKVLNGLFDSKISKVYFERTIKVVRHIESTFSVLNLEEAPPCIIPAEPFFKACWKVNHLISLSMSTLMLLAISSLIIRLFHSWTFFVFLLAFMDGFHVCFQVAREFSLFGGGRADQVISGTLLQLRLLLKQSVFRHRIQAPV